MVRHVHDINVCGQLWKKLIKPTHVSDLWEFRMCFQNHYRHKPCFIVMEEEGEITGMLPLSYVEDEDCHTFFPGEMWKGKTWLERTPCFFKTPDALDRLISECPDKTHLRYMQLTTDSASSEHFAVDEIAYGLDLEKIEFDISTYFKRFTHKRLKGIKKEINGLQERGVSYHLNRDEDFLLMVDWNIDRFSGDSYFFDSRFRNSFYAVMNYLKERKLLHMVSVDISGQTAAVDLGSIYSNTCTLFAGGTSLRFPGISKVINMHHIETAFCRGFARLDFLCGDFCWKKLWHFDQEPLYQYLSPALKLKRAA